MNRRIFIACLLAAVTAVGLAGQASQDARIQILHTVIATEAGARIEMPFGGEGVNLTSAGAIDQPGLEKEIKKHGASIQKGKIVGITDIEFKEKAIEIELDGGGKAKTEILQRIDATLGGNSRPKNKKVAGSRVTLQFPGKVPSNITPEQLREFLGPVLDFSTRTVVKNDLDGLPAEFREAVQAKEARVGMDTSTVLLALGRPNNRIRERVDGVDRESWIYNGAGLRVTFVVFENETVVGVKQY